MKTFLIYFNLFFSILLFAQKEVKIITTATRPEDFIPKNWKLTINTKGDLNKDNLDDIAMVIEDADSLNIHKNDNLGTPFINLNPRYLLILFKNKTTNSYDLKAINKNFIPSENDAENSCLADPLLEDGGVAIKKGMLQIDLNYWTSCGSWSVTHSTYKFRFQENTFQLIGLDESYFGRNTGEETTTSYNYLTHKKCVTSNANSLLDENAKPKKSFKNIKARKLKNLESLKTNTEQE